MTEAKTTRTYHAMSVLNSRTMWLNALSILVGVSLTEVATATVRPVAFIASGETAPVALNGGIVFVCRVSRPPLRGAYSSQNKRQEGNNPIRAIGREPVPPIARRFGVLWSSGFAWLLCWWLAARRDDWRIAIVGLFVLGFGLLLWCLTPYRWTWGWWL